MDTSEKCYWREGKWKNGSELREGRREERETFVREENRSEECMEIESIDWFVATKCKKVGPSSYHHAFPVFYFSLNSTSTHFSMLRWVTTTITNNHPLNLYSFRTFSSFKSVFSSFYPMSHTHTTVSPFFLPLPWWKFHHETSDSEMTKWMYLYVTDVQMYKPQEETNSICYKNVCCDTHKRHTPFHMKL